jgi:hypothetical protein
LRRKDSRLKTEKKGEERRLRRKERRLATEKKGEIEKKGKKAGD